MTIDKYNKAKSLIDEIGRLKSIKKSLEKNNAELCISDGFRVLVKIKLIVRCIARC